MPEGEEKLPANRRKPDLRGTALLGQDLDIRPEIAIRLLPAERHDRAAAIWRQLEDAADRVPLPVSWVWTETWLRHYGDVVPHRFAAGYDPDGNEVGIALLTERIRRKGPVRLRRLHLGTSGEPPGETVFVARNGVLTTPGHRAEFAHALVSFLQTERGWHELELSGFSESEAAPFLEADPSLVPNREPSPRLTLPEPGAGLDGVIALLSSKTRNNVRRQMRKLGEIKTEWAEDDRHRREIFEELCVLHEERWREQGHPGVFASRRFRGFHSDLIDAAPDSVVLFRASNEQGPIACLYALVDGEDVIGYQAGLGGGENARHSPGIVANALMMAECAERGYRTFDTGPGRALYKRVLTNNGAGELVWARSSRLRARVLAPRWRHAGV